jgi:hypothetical protein
MFHVHIECKLSLELWLGAPDLPQQRASCEDGLNFTSQATSSNKSTMANPVEQQIHRDPALLYA